jgi:hypothetical protein
VLQEQAKAERVPALETKPGLGEQETELWQVFAVAHRSRQCGFGVSALPVQEILTVLDLYGFEGEEVRRAFDILVLMDDTYLAHEAKQSKGKDPDADAKTGDRRKGRKEGRRAIRSRSTPR